MHHFSDSQHPFDIPRHPNEPVVKSAEESAIPATFSPFATDYLPKRLDKLQFVIDRIRNAGRSSQPLLLRGGAHTHSDGPPLTAYPGSSNLVEVDVPVCKYLISRAFSLLHDLISLIKAIFANKDEVKFIHGLRGDNTQIFFDVVHEVRFVLFPPGIQPDYLSSTPSLSNFHLPLIRVWISRVSNHTSGGSVRGRYTGSAIVRPCFRDHSRSRFAIIDSIPRCIAAGLLTCGRANTEAAMLLSRY